MKKLNKNNAPKNIINNEKVMNENNFIVSKTDTKGLITYCNQIFIDMSGYTKDELIGANHNLIRHSDMPAVAFKLAWDLIKSGEEFFGFVKNLKKDGIKALGALLEAFLEEHNTTYNDLVMNLQKS